MINKNKFSIKDTKKVLHKVGKRWVVVSAVLLGLVAGGVAVTAQANASANTSLGTEETAVEDQNNPKTVPFHGHNIPENKPAVESDATKYASYADVNNLTKVASVARANNQASAYSSLVNLAQNPQRFISHANNSSEVAVGSDVTNNSDKNTAFSMFDQASNEANAINSGKDNNNKLNKINHAFSFANSLANKSGNISSNVSFSSTSNMFSSTTASNSTVALSSGSVDVTSLLNDKVSKVNSYINELDKASSIINFSLSDITVPSMSVQLSNISGTIDFKSNIGSTLSVPTLINSGYSDIPSTISSLIVSGAKNASSAINSSADSIASSATTNLNSQIDDDYSADLSSGVSNLSDQVSNLISKVSSYVGAPLANSTISPSTVQSDLNNINDIVSKLSGDMQALTAAYPSLQNETLKGDVANLSNPSTKDAAIASLQKLMADASTLKTPVSNLEGAKSSLGSDVKALKTQTLKTDVAGLLSKDPTKSANAKNDLDHLQSDANTLKQPMNDLAAGKPNAMNELFTIGPSLQTPELKTDITNHHMNDLQNLMADAKTVSHLENAEGYLQSDITTLQNDVIPNLKTPALQTDVAGLLSEDPTKFANAKNDLDYLQLDAKKTPVSTLENDINNNKSNIINDAKTVLASELQTIKSKNLQSELNNGSAAESTINSAVSSSVNNKESSVASDINSYLGLSNGQPNMAKSASMVPSLINKYSSALSAAGINKVGPFKSDDITLTSAANSLSTSEPAIDSAVSIVASVKSNSGLNNHISAINNLISTASNYANDITNKYNDLGSGEKASLISNFNGMVSGAADLANNYDYDTQYPAYSAIYSNASSLVSNITNDVNLSAYPVISDAMSYAQSSIADEAEASANTMTSTSNSMSGFLQAASNAINTASSSVKSLENSLLSANSNSNNAIGRVTNAISAYDTISLGDADTSEAALDTDNITVYYKLNGNTKASKSVALEGLSSESFPVSALSSFYNSNDYSKYSLVNSPASTISFNGNGSSADVTITLSSASSSAKTPSSSSAKSSSASSVAPSSSSSAKSSSASSVAPSSSSSAKSSNASSVAPSSENSSASISSNASGMPFIPSFNGGSTIVTPTTSSSVAPSSMNTNSNSSSSSAESKSKVANYVTVNKDLQLHTSPNFTKKNGVAVIKAGTRLDLEKIVRARHGLVRYEVRYNGKNYFVTANKKFTTHISYELAKPSHFRYLKVDKSLQLHTSPYFTKKNGVIVKKPSTEFRINRVVKAHGLVRYEVSYKGNIYFITANDHYVENAYLQKGNFRKHGHKSVRVTKSLYEYKKANFKKHSLIRNFRKGSVLPVKKVLTIAKGEMTRLQLTNGRYVSANKDFVKVIK